MKKQIISILICFMTCLASKAQFSYTTTVTTSTSNEFLQIPAFILESIANVGIGTIAGDKILFAPQLVFPCSIGNDASNDFGEMRGGYARAFSSPWEYIGDYAIGISGAWDHYDKPFGFYIGLKYKSKEVVFKDVNRNDRAHYVSPEVGVRFKFGDKHGLFLEMGTSYDYVFKYKGEMHDYGKDAVNDGFSINVGIGQWNSKGPCQLKFQLPIYNFYNKDFTPDKGMTYPFADVHRNIAYISFLYRYYIEY